jgi:predicted metal-dependent peptidase
MSKDTRALKKMELAKDRLMTKYRFHAAIVHHMVLTKKESIKTLAVCVGRGKAEEDGFLVNLLYNPDFVMRLKLNELVGVLLHEVHHVLFGHLSMTRKDFPNRNALVIAQEVTVNEFVKEPLPENIKDDDGKVIFEKAIFLDAHPELPVMESTLQRYERLKDVIPQTKIVICLDDHDVWEGIEGDGSVWGEDIEEAIKEAIDKLIEESIDDLDKDDMPEDLKNHFKYGRGPGSEFYRLELKLKGKVDWTSQLRKYVGKALDVRPQYHRPNRRFPDLVGIIPGKARMGTKPKVMFQLDTSGSITDEMIEQASGELKSLSKNYEVVVVEFGDVVYNTYPYKGRLEKIYGRGGNEGAPGLERSFLAKHKPDLVVIVTDGHLCVGTDHPTLIRHPVVNGTKVPVLWVVQPGGEKPVEWGDVIWLKGGEE